MYVRRTPRVEMLRLVYRLRREATVASGDWVFRPVGDVDLAVAPSLRSEWYAVIDERLPTRVVVDLQDVTFMDSSGLSVLAGVAKRQLLRGGSVAVCNASSQVAEIMTMTGLNRSVEIISSELPRNGREGLIGRSGQLKTDDEGVSNEDPMDPVEPAEAARERAERTREAALAANERSKRARERGEQLSERLAELKGGPGSMSRNRERAAAAAQAAAEAAEEAVQRASRGLGYAASGMERASEAHEHLAEILEHRSEGVGPEQADELLQRAREHRARAAADRQEADVDRQAREDLEQP